MKRHIPTLSFIALGALVASTYFNFTPEVKSKRVACQNETLTFEKISFGEPVNKAKELLYSGNIELKSRIDYSVNMKSNLKDKLSLEEFNIRFKEVLNNYIKYNKEDKEKLLIKYYLYENDKKDSGKKNDKAKKYAGYLVYEFKLHNNLLYKIQTDYKDIDAKDIENRMQCVLESFISIK